MTHDELQSKIFETHIYNHDYEAITKALYAVTELPMESNVGKMTLHYPSGMNAIEKENYLYEMGYATAMKVVIQAIEKELNDV